MNEREYQYFMMMSENCSEKAKTTQSNTANTPEYPHFNSTSKESEFNRRKITIKAGGRTYGGGLGMEIIDGIYAGSVQSRYQSNWIAYEGFYTVSLVKFFELTGYRNEANRYLNAYGRKTESEIVKLQNTSVAWGALSVVSFLIASSNTDIEEHKAFVHFWVPLVGMFPVSLVKCVNAWDKASKAQGKNAPSGILNAQPNSVFPLQKAVDMAEGYNRQLWNELK